MYPEYEWLPWKFSKCERHFWGDSKNQRKFMDWAGKELGIKDMSDWYKVTTNDIMKIGVGNQFLNHSPIHKLVTDAYPEYEWLPWRFNKCPFSYWNDLKNQRKFMDWAGKQLGIKDMNDWYNVNYKVKIKSFLLCLKSRIYLNWDVVR